MQQPHRPGPLHQTNKPHKGPRASRKASATSEIKNKISSRSSSLSSTKSQARIERLNQACQNRKLKWEKAISDKRSVGSGSQAPLSVGILGQAQNFFAGLAKDESLSIKQINARSTYVVASRLKMRFKLIALDYKKFDETIDQVKSLDLILLLHHPDDIEQGKEIGALPMLQVIYIHCLPTVVHAIDGFDRDNSSMVKVKRLLKAKVGDDKMYAIESASDYMQLFHIIGSCKRQRSTFKESRPMVASDTVSVVDGRLAVTGFVRGKTLNPNDLIHMVGFDDYQMHKIDILPDVVSLKPTSIEGDQVVQTLTPDPMKQETLEQENELDPMEGEQTWPTAEELAGEAERLNTKRVVKKLPLGTSEYQGAWIPESDEDEDDDDEDDDDDDDDFDEEDEEGDIRMGDEELASGDEGGQDDDDDDDDVEQENKSTKREDGDDGGSMMDVDEYDKKYSNEREMRVLEKLRQARLNEMFPDEMDTPVDQPARFRFARYRGLKSFRTSPWDPQENLPPDYSRIFQFQNFQQTKRRALQEESHDGANAGQYVRVHLANVPSAVIDKVLAKSLVPSLVGLLRHERKMTVMNLLIKRLPESNLRQPIKSKDELIFYVGSRKFKARPVFTNHSVSSKHKYERFLSDDVAMVATIYAPVTYPPAPVLVFRARRNGDKELVASGSVLDSNPNRLIIKRMRLSGHPYKIHSKTAVLRFMFFNSEDVLYFKPVELVTRYNRRGHISEPLGTHGHMKCTFDKKIRSDDCVFMNLYKRVFPKWTYEPICE